ncbi:MAG: hypothetical protein A2939_03105 [Parcubacteria group bacterium RIFCSPLOWO2_01_FULL_48_18]|nr:MAG: hypothetical protein A2939_03105 [Parcubacteria group bacterium RIFCSPLOWO2_01_FULL_48_18]OHB23275.1 MAG: hypothetical protein A3J67_04250 [Parcubacteria group bacterium RIFCSPHIGHO2_02_FULL_48_10b]
MDIIVAAIIVVGLFVDAIFGLRAAIGVVAFLIVCVALLLFFNSPFYEDIKWRRWKKGATRAIDSGRVTLCAICNDHVFPNDFVAEAFVGDDPTPKLIHAGFHYSMKERSAFCAMGAIGTGFWDGEKFVKTMTESTAQAAIRTGEAQVGPQE